MEENENTIKKKVFIVPWYKANSDLKLTKKKVKEIYHNHFEKEYDLISLPGRSLDNLDQLTKFIKAGQKADLVIFMDNWKMSIDCILFKRICDEYKIHIGFISDEEDCCRPYDTMSIYEYGQDYDTVRGLVTTLSTIPCNFKLVPSRTDNIYNDFIGVGVNYMEETVTIDTNRVLYIEADKNNKGYNYPDEEDKPIKYFKLSDNDSNHIDEYHVEIDIGKEIKQAILYTAKIDYSEFNHTLYDVYNVFGYDSSDYDCPIKITAESEDDNGLDFIGTVVVAKGSLSPYMNSYDTLYIDGNEIVWDFKEGKIV